MAEPGLDVVVVSATKGGGVNWSPWLSPTGTQRDEVFLDLLCCQGNGVDVAMLLVGGGGGGCCCHGGKGPDGGGGGWFPGGGGGGGIIPTGRKMRRYHDSHHFVGQHTEV